MSNKLANLLYGEWKASLIPHDRCRGKTTGEAMIAIGQAILSPGKKIYLEAATDDESIFNLVCALERIIKANNLKLIRMETKCIDGSNPYIVFELD